MNTFERVELLLVEDSPQDAEMTQHALRRYGVVNDITWVKDGVEAFEYLESTGEYAGRAGTFPRLILLDLKMPRMDGLQVLEKLKGSEQMRSIPVVMLTSSSEETDLVRSYALGVNSYIVKPVGFPEFTEIVRQIGLYWLLTNKVPSRT